MFVLFSNVSIVSNMANVPRWSVPSFCVNVSVVEGHRVNNLTCEVLRCEQAVQCTPCVSVSYPHNNKNYNTEDIFILRSSLAVLTAELVNSLSIICMYRVLSFEIAVESIVEAQEP